MPAPVKSVVSQNSTAQRMRRYRRRRRLRRLTVRIEVDQFEADALVKRGYIDETERDDLTAIGDAVSAFISDVLVTND
jgi:hypothetical protein